MSSQRPGPGARVQRARGQAVWETGETERLMKPQVARREGTLQINGSLLKLEFNLP